MNQPDPKPTAVEERVAKHLASRDWLTDPSDDDSWNRYGPKFRADYLAYAREVIALVREAEPAASAGQDGEQHRKRADQAEELLSIAHETSNRSEAERARAVQRAERAEALLLRFAAEAHRRKWDYDRGLNDDGVPIKSEAFDALHRLGEEMRTALDELRRAPNEALREGAIARCDRALAGKVHPPHNWEPDPGKDLWHCPGDEPFAI